MNKTKNNMKIPSISVVLPVHNSSEFLREALDSLLIQSFKDFEVICIDSGRDDSSDIIMSYATGDDRIRYIYDENSSYGHKINRGIDEAQGDYLSILESDDMFKDNMLDRLFHVAVSNDADYVKSSYTNYANGSGGVIQIDSDRYCNEKFVGEVVDFCNNPELRYYSLNNIWTGLYSIRFLRNASIRFNESPGASYQDTGFSVLCAVYARKVVYLSECLYFYRRDNEGSSVKDQEKYRCIIDEMNWIKSELIRRNKYENEIVKMYNQIQKITFGWNVLRLTAPYRKLFLDLLDLDMNNYLHDLLDKNIEREELSSIVTAEVYKTLKCHGKKSVFGAGEKGRAVVLFAQLLKLDSELILYDNDEGKWGEDILGVKIQNPHNIEEDISFFIVAVDIKYSNDIIDQLTQANVHRDTIVDASGFPSQNELIMWIMKYIDQN